MMKLFCLFLLFFETSSFAELSSPFHLAYSGSGTASLNEDFSHLLNPANLGFHKKSKSALGYSIKQKNQMLSLVFTDTKTGIPLSLNYERYWSDRFVKSDVDVLQVSLGTALNPFFSFGVSIQRKTLKKEDKQVFWNGDLGALLLLSPKTGVAVTVNQLILNEEDSNRVGTIGFYQKLMKTFNARVDLSYSQKEKWVTRGAIETLFRQFLSLRVGGAWNFETKKSLYGAGLSFYGPRLQFDYSIERARFFFQHALIVKLLI